VYIDERRLSVDSIGRLLMPNAALPKRTNKPDQASADQRLETFRRLHKSRFEILQEVDAGGFAQVRFTIAGLAVLLVGVYVVCHLQLHLMQRAQNFCAT
jgi:hypothetical protein